MPALAISITLLIKYAIYVVTAGNEENLQE